MPNFPRNTHGARARGTGTGALQRLARRARRPPRPEHPRVSAVVIEEEAATLLYGERSGMVNASPVVPPLEDREPSR